MSDGQPMQKRFLSLRQAQRCESACEPVCKCRCGGALHGAKRGQVESAPSSSRAFFYQLSEIDPHFVPSKEWKAAKKKADAEARWKRRLDILSGNSPNT